jgi:hypothetical protein
MMGSMQRHRLSLAALGSGLALSLLAGCSSSGAGDGSPSGASRMQAELATSDIYVNAPQRVAVGLIFANGNLVTFGSVGFSFSYLGTAKQPIAPQAGPRATAAYIPTPGTPPGTGSGPTITDTARGVYEAENVTFDATGVWSVLVTADIAGSGTQMARKAFLVQAAPTLPAPGQPALRTENLTIHSKGVPLAAIDSRAAIEGSIPDRNLHEWTIAEAIAKHRPALVVFATPEYCMSRFCGPVTDAVELLSRKYANRAEFIHVEIYRNYKKNVINKAAADWLYRKGNLTEPWLYLIGANGTILDRWSSLFDVREVARELQKLPPMKG